MKPSHLRGKERAYEVGFIAACFGILGLFYYATYERRDPTIARQVILSKFGLDRDPKEHIHDIKPIKK